MLVSDAHGGFGGIAQYNRDVIDAMAGLAGISEIVVLPRVIKDRDFTPPRSITYDLGGTGGSRAYLLRSIWRGLSAERFDLVYCAHINLMPLAAAIALFRQLPLVLAIYGIDAWEKPRGVARGFGVSAASLVISISQLTLDRFLVWSGVDRNRCVILPNAIHLADYGIRPKNRGMQSRFGIVDKRVIMTLGRMVSMERYKGFDQVIELMPELIKLDPEIIYIAAGDGEDKARLEAKARELGVADSVIFPGRVSEAEKADLYRLADAYVMPSSGEGFGFVVLEALACGIPVVASSADGTREAVRNGELGLLVNPSDASGLKDAIFKAISRPKQVPPGLEYFSFENFRKRLGGALARVMPNAELA